MPTAIWNGKVIAETTSFETVEGNIYFPADSIKKEYFSETTHSTVCSWKGTASYYTITVDGKKNENAAWYYKTPKDAAKNIAGYVAFWKGVEGLTLLEMPTEIHDNISLFLPLPDYLNFRRYTCRRLLVGLLEQEYPEPSELLELAAKRNRPQSILYILLHRHPSTVDAAKNNNHLIRWAAVHGYTDVVQALLGHPTVRPDAVGVVKSVKDNKFKFAPAPAVALAARMGHLQIVQLLLSDVRVDSQSCHTALVIACANGQIEIVNLLLARVNPAAKNSLALRQACHYGHLDIVKLLLRDKRVNPAAADNLAYYYAYERGYYKIADLLLKDNRVQEVMHREREVGWMGRD